jgi:hypothetical protein
LVFTEKLIRNDMEGSGHSLIDGSILEFALGNRKVTKHPPEQLVSRQDANLTTHVTNVTA